MPYKLSLNHHLHILPNRCIFPILPLFQNFSSNNTKLNFHGAQIPRGMVLNLLLLYQDKMPSDTLSFHIMESKQMIHLRGAKSYLRWTEQNP